MIEEGDTVMLWDEGKIKLLTANGGMKRVSGIGVIDTDKFIGKKWGRKVKLGRDEYRLLQPSLEHAPEYFKRKAQIILPRVCQQLIHYCDISCGDKAIEGGAGSGMLSAVLLRAVGEEGEVITYEIREDFLKTAKKNLKDLGLTDNWTGIHGDITKSIEESDADAFIVDIPEPWEALMTAHSSLKSGGFFASYVPTTNQLQKIYLRMKEKNYADMKAFESIEREMVVSEEGVRPSYDMLGHTGYIAVGRRCP